MTKSKRTYTPEFKAKIALEALRGRYTVKEIAANFDIHPSLVHAWRQSLSDSVSALFAGQGSKPEKNPALRAMNKQLDDLMAEQEWMRRAISSLDLTDKRACVDAADEKLSILCQSRLLGLHRSGIYYKKRRNAAGSEPAAAGTENGAESPELTLGSR